MASSRSIPGIAAWTWLAVAVAALVVLFLVDPPKSTLLLEVALDAGHAPLFGVIGVALLGAIRRLDLRGYRPYLLAWAAAAFLGASTELLQYFGPRDASFGDLARNLLGATSFLTAALSLREKRGVPRARGIVAALVLFGIAMLPLALAVDSYRGRNAAFPTICNFDSRWCRLFTGVKDGDMTLEVTPGPCGPPGSGRAAKVTLHPATYPGLGIREPYPDWTGYDTLAFEVYSEAEHDIELALRIHDRAHDRRYEDRFNRTLVIHPGCNPIRVPLEEVRRAPEGREMDMTEILGVVLFAVRPSESLAFYVDSVRLEASGRATHAECRRLPAPPPRPSGSRESGETGLTLGPDQRSGRSTPFGTRTRYAGPGLLTVVAVHQH